MQLLEHFIKQTWIYTTMEKGFVFSELVNLDL